MHITHFFHTVCSRHRYSKDTMQHCINTWQYNPQHTIFHHLQSCIIFLINLLILFWLIYALHKDPRYIVSYYLTMVGQITGKFELAADSSTRQRGWYMRAHTTTYQHFPQPKRGPYSPISFRDMVSFTLPREGSPITQYLH